MSLSYDGDDITTVAGAVLWDGPAVCVFVSDLTLPVGKSMSLCYDGDGITTVAGGVLWDGTAVCVFVSDTVARTIYDVAS